MQENLLRGCGRLSVLVLSTIAGLRAQCDLAFTPGEPFAGGYARSATAWDPDGAGPLGTSLAFVDNISSRVRAFDLTTQVWRTLPGAVAGGVYAMAALPNGDLIIAGWFTAVGTVAAANIARWDGTAWQALGTGTDATVHCLVVMPSGDLIAGGEFTAAGGTPVNYIARWNGGSWTPLDTGVDDRVFALVVDGAGALVAGGAFASAGGIATGGIARWKDAGWNAVDPSLTFVMDLAVAPNGDLYASLGVKVVRITASGSTTLGSFDELAWALAFDGSGALLVGGEFQTVHAGGSLAVEHIARWDGQAWSSLPSARVEGISWMQPLGNGDLAIGGSFDSEGVSNGVRRWNGTTWGVFGLGLDGGIGAMLREPSGAVVVAGLFGFAGGVEAGGLARWQGHSFAPIGGVPNGRVRALARAPNGDLVVGGEFTAIGGVAAHKVARWNGATWSAVPGLGAAGHVAAMVFGPNGDLIVGGGVWLPGAVSDVGLARWDGTSWSALGSPDWWVYLLAVAANGDIVGVGDKGPFPRAQVRAWNGSSWTLLASATNWPWVTCLLPLANGDLLVGGQHLTFGGIAEAMVARWNGASWSAVGRIPQGLPYAMRELPDGDVLAAGEFTSSAAGGHVLNRWNGIAWTPVGPRLANGAGGGAFDVAADGTIVLTGGGLGPESGRGWLATLAPTCPASAVAFGSGCAGSSGVPTLTAEAFAWLGGTFTSRCENVPAGALVVAAYGFSAMQVPLSLVSPLAAPGCDGLVAPHALDVVLPHGGVARALLAIPTAPALLGASFFHQHLPIEFAAAGVITAITASNALQLRIGAL